MWDLLREAGNGLLDLLYPPRCLLCDALADPFCAACQVEIEPLEPGAPIPKGVADLRSEGYHSGALQSAVLHLKFRRKVALAHPLGELLARELQPVLPIWRPAAIVPVPIHTYRRCERGYNQAELIAQVVGKACGLPVAEVLRRTRATPPQVGRTRAARAVNLHGAFAVSRPKQVQGVRLVLLDDVRTTGATLTECAAALRAAGAAEVYALTVTFEP